MTSGKVKTLFSDKEKTEALFPRTKTSAVSNEDGIGLDALMENLIYSSNENLNQDTVPLNADTLGGFPAEDYASKLYVKEQILKVQEGTGVDLSEFATKEDLASIDFPVDSVNGKTGTVQLSASDVGAASANSVGTNKVFNKLTDIGITSFPTTMKTVANAMPANSTLMLDSRDITTGGAREISDLGLNNAGMYMFMRGNSVARLSLLHIYGATSSTTSYMNFGCYVATNNSVVWKHVDLSDFAPSGYGYGGQAINLGIFDNEDDLTNAIASVYDNMDVLETKMIRFQGYPSNSSFNFFGVLAKGSANNGNLLVQCSYYRGSLVQKSKYQGTWQPLEWINPPMVVDTQYRTAERYQGKVVHAKLVNFGSLPNNTTKQVGFCSDGCTNVVSITAILDNGCVIHGGTGKDLNMGKSYNITLNCTKYNIRILTDYDFSSRSAYVLVKYTLD